MKYKRNDLIFHLTPFKLSLDPKYKEGNTFLTYLCSNFMQHVQSRQKTVRKCVEFKQVIVTFRLKMKSCDQFQNKHGAKLNKVFLLFTK